MTMVWAIVVVVACVAVAVAAMLAARSRAPEGSHFQDGDRAAGVFGVLATGFALLLGLVVVLAFTSYDDARAGAEVEALLVAQQYETAQFMPAEVRGDLSGDLVCYARYVVHQEWPQMEDGSFDEAPNPWAAGMFRRMRPVEPVSNAEQNAYGKWFDQTSEREAARNDRIHGAAGVIPGPLWLVLMVTAAIIFGFMLLFADSAEPRFVQAIMMGSVVAVMTSSLLLISLLNHPFREGYGGLPPRAMTRTLTLLDEERAIADETPDVPCDDRGLARP